MAAYPIAFIITALLAFMSEKSNDARLSTLLKICSIIPLSLLAGLRDINIGTDQLSYVYETYLNSHYVNITDLNYAPSPLYGAFVWVLTRLVDAYWFNLLCTQLFINGLIYLSLYQLGSKYAWVGITLYNLVGYCYTLNYVRQAMAIAICLYALRFAFKKSFIKFCILLAIATGFHQTAVVAFPLYFAFSIDSTSPDDERRIGIASRKRYSFLVKYCILCAVIMAIVFIATNLEVFSILKESYADQLNYGGSDSIGMLVFFVAFTVIFLFFGTRPQMNRMESPQKSRLMSLGRDLSFGLIVGIFMYSLSYIGRELFRLSLYYLLLLPHYAIIKVQLTPKKQRSVLVGSLLTLACLFWAWKFVWQNVGDVTPYVVSTLL